MSVAFNDAMSQSDELSEPGGIRRGQSDDRPSTNGSQLPKAIHTYVVFFVSTRAPQRVVV